jgi:DNA helicase HerA-like ATPase
MAENLDILKIVQLKDGAAGILNKFANRHGLITGATGTGKTVTLQVVTEQLSRAGVPVFAADIKGDLSGISQPGSLTEKMTERLKMLGLESPEFKASPVQLWDLFGKSGTNLRATISEMGPLLLSRLLDLNETQEGVLNIAFKLADEKGLLLIDLKDLRAVLAYIAENADQITSQYGNASAVSVGAIQRGLLVLENQGAESFFGRPELALSDLMQIDATGKGVVNLLDATVLMQNPKVYSTFLLWLLNELFEQLPEVGDLDKPKLVFFFDEAHLLFSDAPKALIDKIEQVVKLIRSKGVGIYFVTQNPLDIPESVLAQLGNRIQHALRAYTPMEQKAVKAAATAFRVNPDLDTEKVITELGTGEVLISCLDEKGAPSIVQRGFVMPPEGQIGPIDPSQRDQLRNASTLNAKYSTVEDAESAYEKLKAEGEAQEKVIAEAEAKAEEESTDPKKSTRMSPGERFINNMLGSIGREVGNKISRGILGGILGGKR